MNVVIAILTAPIRLYQVAISPLLSFLLGPLGMGCRFHPTCSHYAIDALRTHGPFKGCFLALGRLCRCHPWGGSGHDPVPPPTRHA